MISLSLISNGLSYTLLLCITRYRDQNLFIIIPHHSVLLLVVWISIFFHNMLRKLILGIVLRFLFEAKVSYILLP